MTNEFVIIFPFFFFLRSGKRPICVIDIISFEVILLETTFTRARRTLRKKKKKKKKTRVSLKNSPPISILYFFGPTAGRDKISLKAFVLQVRLRHGLSREPVFAMIPSACRKFAAGGGFAVLPCLSTRPDISFRLSLSLSLSRSLNATLIYAPFQGMQISFVVSRLRRGHLELLFH